MVNKKSIVLIHSSPAAVQPINGYYNTYAPEFEYINLLDEELLGLFREKNEASIISKIMKMIDKVIMSDQASLAVLTCTAISTSVYQKLAQECTIPVIKVDEAMAKKAIQNHSSLGVLATFRPGLDATMALLNNTMKSMNKEMTIYEAVNEAAYAALLAGNTKQHNELLIQSALEMAKLKPAAIVLSQVSMASLKADIEKLTKLPVYTSPGSSLEVIKNYFNNCEK